MRTETSLAAGAIAAFGATACCFGPLLLVTLGLGGAWAARMRMLEPLQPVFIVATLAFMGFAVHRLYRKPRECEAGEACAVPAVLRRQRIAFWIVAAIIAAMASFPLLSPLLY